MSLQQALLAHVPHAQERMELEKIMAANRYYVGYHHLDTSNGFALLPPLQNQVRQGRQAFYVAQNQLRRLSCRYTPE